MTTIDSPERERSGPCPARGGGDPWFRCLPAELGAWALERAVVCEYDKDRLISCQGDAPRGLLAIARGKVAATHWLGREEEILVDLVGPGRCLGLASLLLQRTSCSFVARTAVAGLLVPQREFERLFAREPQFLVPLARAVAEENLALTTRLSEQRLSPEERIRGRLAALAERQLREQDLGGPVELELSQSDLAALAGLSRQTTNVLLRQLARDGLVEISFCRIGIPDPAALATEHETPGSSSLMA